MNKCTYPRFYTCRETPYNMELGGTPPDKLLFIGVSYTSPSALTLGDSIGVDPSFSDIAPDPMTPECIPRLMLGVANS